MGMRINKTLLHLSGNGRFRTGSIILDRKLRDGF